MSEPREWTFEIVGDMVGAVRTVRSDAWKPNPAIDRYHLWRDQIRLATPKSMTRFPDRIKMLIMVPMPENWSEKKKAFLCGRGHCQKPDIDNIVKGVLDAMFESDQMISGVDAIAWWSRQVKRPTIRMIVVEHRKEMIDYLTTGKIP